MQTVCRKNGMMLSDDQVRLLANYVDQLLDWNKKINLISRRDEQFVWQNHILHSISPFFKIALKAKPRVLDLGTGGGLPGIPLKIVLPDAEFLLVDSTKKKILAVQEMLKQLSLNGISAIWSRVEDLAKDRNLLSHFDYIVARAVAPLNDLIEWSRPLLGTSGASELQTSERLWVQPPALIASKGGDLEKEIERAQRAGRSTRIKVLDLVFLGSEDLQSTGKKLVIVNF